jgi:uncharacterized membrane protein (UPF0127 family)
MKKSIKFYFYGRRITVLDYTICKSIYSKIRGLMFRDKNYKKPLLFVWNKPVNISIHSFFCRKFIAVWLLRGRVIDIKVVNPRTLSVTSKGKFDELLEIPLNYDGIRKI